MFSSSSNPMFREKTLQRAAQNTLDGDFIKISGDRMTVSGAVNKSLILGAIMLLTAVVGFTYASPVLMWGGAILGLVTVLAASFKPEWSTFLAPLYEFYPFLKSEYSFLSAGLSCLFRSLELKCKN